jgi:hypothetical protein
MKCTLFFLAVTVLALSTCFGTPEVGGTEVGGDFWFRYHLDIVDESTQRSAFNVERGYVGLGHTWTPQVSGQMTINVFTSPAELEIGSWQFELRDAYVNLGYWVPHGKTRLGLQKNYFATVYDWKYMTVRRSFADETGVVQERDYGLAFLGTIPDGMGEWSLALMNGEGFTSGLSPLWADKQPSFMANIRLMPIMETVIGLSFLADKRWVYPWDDLTYANRIEYGNRTAFSLMARGGSGPFSLLAEYLYHDYPIPDRDDPENKAMNVTGQGFSIFPTVRLSEKFDLVGRWDFWDPDKDSDHPIWLPPEGCVIPECEVPRQWWVPAGYDAQYYYTKHYVYVLGFNYNITERIKGTPGVIFQFNWQRMDPKESFWEYELDPVDSYVFQVRWGWGGLDF